MNVDRLQGCRLSVSEPLCLFTADRRRRASWRRLCLICRRVRTLSTAPETVTRLWPVERCRLRRHLLKRSQTAISEASSTLTTCTQSTDHVSRYVYTAGVLRTTAHCRYFGIIVTRSAVAIVAVNVIILVFRFG